MWYYFTLQNRMLNRQIADFGMPPVVGYLLAPLGFAGLSVLLFLKIEYAIYLYILIALVLVSGFSEPGRSRFLKSCFSTSDYYWVRIIENILVALPFAVFLMLRSAFLPTLLLVVAAILMAFFNFKNSTNFSLPTPFYKLPFEFAVGFRSTFPAFILAWFLVYMAVVVNNFNLGIFALLLVFFVCITFYNQPEDEFFVWIFSLGAKGFLFHKIKVALLYSTWLCLPVVIGLGLFYTSNLAIIAGFLCLGYVYLATVILAKYSAFPDKMNVPQVVIITFSLLFPPLLLAVIPFFYIQSVKRLNNILE